MKLKRLTHACLRYYRYQVAQRGYILSEKERMVSNINKFHRNGKTHLYYDCKNKYLRENGES